MKRTAIFILLLYTSVASAQLSTPFQQPTLIVDAKAGVSAIIPPDFSRWSETVRLVRSPDVRTSLDVGGTLLLRLSNALYGGVEISYGFFEDAIDATTGVQQLRLTGIMLMPAAVVAFVPLEPLQSRALVKFTFGAGALFGTVNNTLAAPQTYSTTGATLLAEFTFGLPIGESVVATFNAALRGGLTGGAKNGSVRLEYLDSDRQVKPVTLTFIAGTIRFGIALKL
ncbi:MAG: hypothetical protein ACK42Y_07255 [Candidatus Thermochlorobacter sp.]